MIHSWLSRNIYHYNCNYIAYSEQRLLYLDNETSTMSTAVRPIKITTAAASRRRNQIEDASTTGSEAEVEYENWATKVSQKKLRNTASRSTGLAQIYIVPSLTMLLVRVYIGGELSVQSEPYMLAAEQFGRRAFFNAISVNDIRPLRWNASKYTGYLTTGDVYGIIAHPVQGLDPYLENWDLSYLTTGLAAGFNGSIGHPDVQEILEDSGAWSQVSKYLCPRLITNI